MSSLYLFQFAALVFMLVNALFVALARLNARWKNKRYERSRLMIFLALVLLSAQYYVQMRFHIRATDDHLGAMVNMLVYTPCFGLIAMAIYNLEAVQAKRRNMALACAGFYAAIVGCFALGHYLRGSWHIGGWLYPMLALYSVHMIYCVLMIRKETHKRRRMLETLTATDLLPYVRYSYASVVNLCLAALVTPVAILSTTTLYIFGPLVLMAILFFVLTFISLGTGYMPSEELLDSEGEELAAGASLPPSGASACAEASTVSPSGRSALSEERIALIQERIDTWCVQRGYKDYSIRLFDQLHDPVPLPQHLQGRSGRLFLPAPAHHVSGVAERYSFSRCTEYDAGAPSLQQRRDLCRVWFLLAHAALPHLQGERGMYANCLARTPVATGPLGAMKPSFLDFFRPCLRPFAGVAFLRKRHLSPFQCNTYLVGMQHICAGKIHTFSSENPNFAAWAEWINLQHCLKAMSNSTSVSA